MFHQRFSTNTWPQWRLAQPFRYLAHNGEINTLHGNRNWSRAREQKFATPLIPNMDDIRPIVGTSGSDSLSLDNMLEGLVMGGVGLFRALRLMVPPAWQNVRDPWTPTCAPSTNTTRCTWSRGTARPAWC